VRATVAAVICMLLIGASCYSMASALVPAFLALDSVGMTLLSLLACAPFVLACAFQSFRVDLRERKQAWLG